MKKLIILILLLSVKLYSQSNFTVEWESASDRHFENFQYFEKNNSIPEIVFRSLDRKTIYVHDGATKNLKYTYSDPDTSYFTTYTFVTQTPIDVNNDGIFEIISTYDNSTTYRVKVINGANGNVLFQKIYNGYTSGYVFPYEIDGDGYTELCVRLYNGGYTKLYIISTTSNYIGIKENTSDIDNYELKQNYPNPFNPSTTIEYIINKSASVEIKIYDVIGKNIKTISKGTQNPGTYKENLTSENLSSGTYYYQIIVDGVSEAKKMVLVK